MSTPRVLVTGASGYLGSQLVAALAADTTRRPEALVAMESQTGCSGHRLGSGFNGESFQGQGQG